MLYYIMKSETKIKNTCRYLEEIKISIYKNIRYFILSTQSHFATRIKTEESDDTEPTVGMRTTCSWHQ